MDELAAEAVRANPKLEALNAQIASLEARADGARMWMDPTVAVEYSMFPWDTWSLGDSPMTGVQVKVQQTFPFPGKNDRREAVAAADTAVKRLEREELALQLAGMVRERYLDLALVRQLKKVTEEQISRVAELTGRVRLRYEVGKGNQQDVLQLELLGERLGDDLEEFDQHDAELTATINGVLHRDVRTPIETPETLELTAPGVELDWLLEQAIANRPALAAYEKKAAALRLDGDRIEWERKPDFTVWLGYRFRAEAGMDDGTDFLSIGVSMPIPFDYTGATEARKRAALEQAGATERGRAGAIDDIAANLERALAGWKRAVGKEKTYRERLVPAAHNTLDASLLAYETDRTDFFSIYRSELDLIQFERAIRTALAQAAKMQVTIETLIGVRLEDATKEAE
jgi:outer membrane protein TolC